MPGPRYTIEQLKQLRESPLCKAPVGLPPTEQWIDLSTEPQRRSKLQSGRADENEHPVGASRRPSFFEPRYGTRHSKDGEDVFLGPKMSFAASASAARHPIKGHSLDDRQGIPTNEEPKHRQDKFSALRDRGERERVSREGGDSRDRTFDRQRARIDNPSQNNHEWGGIPEGRVRSKFEDWKTKNRERFEKDEETAESTEPGTRKGIFGRGGKFDKPWFRDGGTQEVKEPLEGQPEARTERSSWRDHEYRGNRERSRGTKVEQDPQWMKEPDTAEFVMHTQEDFQKWKEQMKAEERSQSLLAKEDEQQAAIDPSTSAPLAAGALGRITGADENLFGTWGETKKSEEARTESEIATAKAALKAKSSRFAGFFGAPKHDHSPAPAPAHPPPPSAATVHPSESLTAYSPPPTWMSPNKGTTTADQEGFERMMQMLRMGSGSASHGPQKHPLFSPPPLVEQPQHKEASVKPLSPEPPRGVNQQSHTQQVQQTFDAGLELFDQLNSQRSSNTDQMQKEEEVFHSPPPSANEPQPRRQTVDRSNSEFLLNLMQRRQQSRVVPFEDGQIYGHSFNHRIKEADQSPDYEGQSNQVVSKGQEDASQNLSSRGPPPGFFGNEQAFSVNQNLDLGGTGPGSNGVEQGSGMMAGRIGRSDHMISNLSMFDQPRFQSNPENVHLQQGPHAPGASLPGQHTPHQQHHHHHHTQSHQQASYEQHQRDHQREQHTHQWSNGRPPSGVVSAHDSIAPPPGFPPGGRGPAPPGFFSFPPPPLVSSSQQQQDRGIIMNNNQNSALHSSQQMRGIGPGMSQPLGPPNVSQHQQMHPGQHPSFQHQHAQLQGPPPPGSFFNGSGASPIGPQQGPPGFPHPLAHVHHQNSLPLGPVPMTQQQQRGQVQQRRPPSGPPGFFPVPPGASQHPMQYISPPPQQQQQQQQQHMPTGAGAGKQ